jgi:hypothetical protein
MWPRYVSKQANLATRANGLTVGLAGDVDAAGEVDGEPDGESANAQSSLHEDCTTLVAHTYSGLCFR